MIMYVISRKINCFLKVVSIIKRFLILIIVLKMRKVMSEFKENVLLKEDVINVFIFE